MNQAILDLIESKQFRKNPVDFGVGDTVRVHTKVVEGDKERIQIFTGVVIGKRGRGSACSRCIRRASIRSKWSAKARCAGPSLPTFANASEKAPWQ